MISVLRVLHVLDSLNVAAVRQVDINDPTIDASDALDIKPLLQVFCFVDLGVGDRSKALFLDSDFSSLHISVDLSAIRMLAVRGSVGVGDQHHFISSESGDDASMNIGLLEAVQRSKVSRDSVLGLPPKTLLVSQSPLEIGSVEVGHFARWVHNLTVVVAEVSHYDSFVDHHSAGLFDIRILGEHAFLDLDNLTVGHVSHHKAILEGRGGTRASADLIQLGVIEELVKVISGSLLEDGLSFWLRDVLSLLLLGQSDGLLDSLGISSQLLFSLGWRLDLLHFPLVSDHLYVFNVQLGLFVAEVEPQLVGSDRFVAHKAILMLDWQVLLILANPETEVRVVLVNSRVDSMNTTNLILLRGQDSIAIWEELLDALRNVSDSLLIDIKERFWEHVCRQNELLWWLGVISWDVVRILLNHIWSEVVNKALERRHDSLFGLPVSEAMRLLLVLGGSLRTIDPVVEQKHELVSSWIVGSGHIWVHEESLLYDRSEAISLKVLVELPLKHLVLRLLVLALLILVDAQALVHRGELLEL